MLDGCVLCCRDRRPARSSGLRRTSCRGGRPCPPASSIFCRTSLMFVGADAERSCSRRRSVTDAACPLRVLIGLRFAPPFPFLLQKRKRCRPPKEKRAAQNRKCIPCRHRVRRSQLHSVSAGAAKTPYPQPSSSFPNCDRFTGSQFGHLEFYNAARDLDDGGHFSASE